MKFWVVGLLLTISLSGLLWPIHFDEGVFWTIGSAMQNLREPDKMIYRDLWDHKPPGIHLVASFLPFDLAQGKLRQESMVGVFPWLEVKVQALVDIQPWIPAFAGMTVGKIWLPRLVVILNNLVAAGLIYQIGKKVRSKEVGVWSMVSWLVLLHGYEGQFWLTETFMVTWVLAATWLAVSDLSFPRRRESMVREILQTLGLRFGVSGMTAMGPRLRGDDGFMIFSKFKTLLTGICLGMAMVFNQKAIVNAAVIGGWCLVICWGEKGTHPSSAELRAPFDRGDWGKLGMLVLGMVMVWVPVLRWLYLNGALDDFWQAVVIYNLTEYEPMWGETLKNLWWLVLPGVGVWTRVVYQFERLFTVARIPLRDFRSGLGFLAESPVRRLTDGSPARNGQTLLWLMVLAPLPFILTRPYHHYWLQILPFAVLVVVGGLWKTSLQPSSPIRSRTGSKRRGGKEWWRRWLLAGNLAIVGLVAIGYGLVVGWPKQQEQIRQAASIQECGDFKEEPWVYYLSGCRPEEKYFYRLW